jgi:hypothetical protein
MRSEMHVLRARLVLVAALVVGAAMTAFAESGPTSPLVRVELVSEGQSIAPGETFWVARHRPG